MRNARRAQRSEASDRGTEDHQAKVRLRELARQLNDISRACQLMGYSELPRREPMLTNRVAPEMEAAVVELGVLEHGQRKGRATGR